MQTIFSSVRLEIVPPELLNPLLQQGVLGLVVIGLLFGYKHERDERKAANERARKAEQSRTEDAQKVAGMLLEQQEKSSGTLSTLGSAIEGNQHAIRAIEQEVRTAVNLMRSK